jgi:hypothetical protein
MMAIRGRTFAVLPLLMLLGALAQEPAPLRVVGVQGNTSGLSDVPIPRGIYTGLAIDEHERLLLWGSPEGFVVADLEGRGLAVRPLPDLGDRVPYSPMVRSARYVFGVATNGRQSTLYRIDTENKEAARLEVKVVQEGEGHWTLATTPDSKGRILVGQASLLELTYRVVAVDPASGKEEMLFETEMEEDQPPMQPRVTHRLVAEPDGGWSIQFSGKDKEWKGLFSAAGKKVSPSPRPGMILDGFRYAFEEGGRAVRYALDGKPDIVCGEWNGEIPRPYQAVRSGDRVFFATGADIIERLWKDETFQYARRIGGLAVDELSLSGNLALITSPDPGRREQGFISLPLHRPLGTLMGKATLPEGRMVRDLVALAKGPVLVYGRDGRFFLTSMEVWQRTQAIQEKRGPLLEGTALEGIQQVGQVAPWGNDLLIADPASGTLWQQPIVTEPILDANGAPTRLMSDVPGVTGVAATPDGVFMATPTVVSGLSADGKDVLWTAKGYKGVRRLAAAGDSLYVCDTAAHVVDQLDAKTGKLRARLGSFGQAGSDLAHLRSPRAIAADLNGVTVADTGNARILIATSTLWKLDITRLRREEIEPVAVRFPINPPEKGRMSLNIFDSNNVTVRQLVSGGPTTNEVGWDGRDLYGRWVKPGEYRYRGAIVPHLSLRYVTSVGQSGNPPYRTEDGKGSWGGVWHDVMDICPIGPEPDTDIVVVWGIEEGEGCLIRMSQDGQVRWKQHADWGGVNYALACDGRDIYIAMSRGPQDDIWDPNQPALWRVDAATGAKKPLSGKAQEPLRLFGELVSKPRRPIVTSLAVHEGKLYFTSPPLHRVFVADAQTGKELQTWEIPDVSGIAIDAKRQIVVGSGNKLLKLDENGKVLEELADLGGEIWDVKPTPEGNVLVSVGEPRHQVVLLSASGKELRTLGKKGGRPLVGKMQPDSLLRPSGVAAMPSGRIFVAENSTPRRFTRWSKDGALERQFHGPYYMSGKFFVDEDQPEHLYYTDHNCWVRYQVDYATGAWEVDRYWMNFPIIQCPGHVRHHEGRTFLTSRRGGVFEVRDDRIQIVAEIISQGLRPDEKTGLWERDQKFNYRPYTVGTWSDVNGNGQRDRDEWNATTKPACGEDVKGYWEGHYFDRDLNYYFNGKSSIWRIPARWQNGVPVYRWEDAERVSTPRPEAVPLKAGPGTSMIYAAPEGIYASILGDHPFSPSYTDISKYDPATGKPVWHAGMAKARPPFVRPGEFNGPQDPGGMVAGYVFWTDYVSLVHVFDEATGLYVDSLLENLQRVPDPYSLRPRGASPYMIWVELFSSRVLRHPKTGKIYMYGASDALHIYEVLGTEKRPAYFEGTFTVSAEQIAQVERRVLAETRPQVRAVEIRRADRPVRVDGDLSDLRDAEEIDLTFRPEARAKARLLRDDKFLYLGLDVTDESPWKNAGGDIRTLYKTGDSVSLWLGPSAGARPDAPGDIRILFAPMQGKNVAVAYRPKSKNPRPETLQSPGGKTTFDKIEPLEGVQVDVRTSTGGYQLKAAIPLDVLDLDRNLGQLGFDLSVTFSDPAGEHNVADLRWGRNGLGIVYDIPTEARFEPSTWGVAFFTK